MPNLNYPNIKQSVLIFLLVTLLLFVFKLVFSFIDSGSLNAFLVHFFAWGSLLVIVYKIRKENTDVTGFSFRRIDCRLLPFLLIGMVCLHCLSNFDPTILLFRDVIESIESHSAEIKPDIFSCISIVMMTPILEELVFRGIMLDGLLKQYSVKKAIAVSAILFTILHYIGLLIVLLFAMFSGWIYYRSKNLWLCILSHFFLNLTSFIGMVYLYSNKDQLVNLPFSWGVSDNLVINILVLCGLILTLGACVYFLNKQFDRRT